MRRFIIKQWRLLRSSPPGKRFQKVYEQRSEERGEKGEGRKSLLMALAIILAVAGVAFLPLPGPGSIVLLAALAVLARESLWVARLLDMADRKRHLWMQAMKRRWKACGRRERAAVVVAAVILMALGLAGAAWWLSRVMS